MSSESSNASCRDLRRSIRLLSQSLGATPDAVATSLADLQVRGSPRNSTACALARYLGAVIGTEMTVADLSVSDRHVRVSQTDRHLPVVVRLPRPVTGFIRGFDRGFYPELIDMPSRPGAGVRSQARSPQPDSGL